MALILVIDDMPDHHERYRRYLQGHQVECALDSLTGRPLIGLHFDNANVIILDGNLGEDDPEPTTLAIASELRVSGFKGALFAATNDDALREKLLAHGCTHSLNPLKPHEWPELIDEALHEI